jgi:hypothetical protein
MRILGVTASGFLGFDSSYELITTTILPSAESSVVFSNLDDYSSTYKHLQIRLVARGDRAAVSDAVNLRINADTGSNYAFHLLGANGSSVYSYGEANTNRIPTGDITAATFAANAFGALVIDILEPYSTTKNKTVRSFGGNQGQISLFSGHRRNTESTTSISLIAATNSFVAGSRFSLYGIKG